MKMNKKGQIFALIFYILFLIGGIVAFYYWYTYPASEERIVPLVLFISGTGLICMGLIGLWTIFRTGGNNCWGDIIEGKPEAIELLHERIKRIEEMPDDKTKN